MYGTFLTAFCFYTIIKTILINPLGGACTEMTLEQLIYFSESNKYHSFTKAADVLYVSQSTISMSIANLEKELGLKLFTRSKSGLSLTVHGEAVLAHTHKILAEVNHIEAYVSMHNAYLTDTIKVACAPLFAESIMPYVIAQLAKHSPNLQIKLYENDNLSIIQALFQRKVHFGIIGYREMQSQKICSLLHEKNLTESIIFTSQLCCYLKSSHPLSEKEEICLQDLLAYQVIVHEFSGQDLGNYLRRQGANVIEANNYDIIYRLLYEDDFVAIIPHIFFSKDEAIVNRPQVFFPNQVTYALLHNND